MAMDCRETLTTSDSKPQLCDFVKIFLVLIVSVAAVLTVLTHIAQISGMPFSTYAIIGTCVAVIVAGYVLWREFSKQALVAVTAHRMQALSLLACCMFGGLLSLVSHRHAFDDFLYIPNAIYYLEHPKEPMDFKVHFVDSGQGHEPFTSYHGCSVPFEHSQNIVAYITRCHFLTVYYFLAPALFGGMIPLVWFYLISRFSFPSRSAITGSFIICMSLILMGEQHRSFGNLAFNRIFEGKTVMLAIGIPLFTALTIDFFRSACWRNWLYLFATAVAMIGLTASATVLIPLLAFVLAFACYFSYVTNMRSHVKRSILYFFTLLYPALSAVSILLSALNVVSSDTLNKSFPLTFSGQAKGVLCEPVVMSFLICGVISAIIFVRKRDRYFLATWVILIMALYLNPVVAPFMIKHVTSPNIYWRLFYLLPFPLVIGLSGAAVSARLENKSPKWRRIVFGTVTALLLAAHLPPSSSSIFRRGPRATKLGMPRYKVQEVYFEQTRKLLALNLPAGPMLAIPAISITLPTLTSKYPQIFYTVTNLLLWMELDDRKTEGRHRIAASRFLGGQISKKGLESLVWVIRHNPQIRSIVADRRVAELDNSYLFRLLSNRGFSEYKLTDNLAVFIRPSSKK
jgi:hypothetical protein